jgi:hypothetical protein
MIFGLNTLGDEGKAILHRDELVLGVTTAATLWFKGAPRSWLVQAAKLPTVKEDPNYPKVVALLFPSGYGKDKIAS